MVLSVAIYYEFEATGNQAFCCYQYIKHLLDWTWSSTNVLNSVYDH